MKKGKAAFKMGEFENLSHGSASFSNSQKMFPLQMRPSKKRSPASSGQGTFC
jgi:hypothetical protein